MTLPKWIEEIGQGFSMAFTDGMAVEKRTDYRLYKALAIAAEALQEIANHDQTKWFFERSKAFNALIAIEKMGEEK